MSSQHNQSRENNEISRHLTFLLRHNRAFYERHFRPRPTDDEPTKQLKLQGFASIADILSFREGRRFPRPLEQLLTPERIIEVVESQTEGGERSKVRNALNEAKTHVRAINGHSNGLRLEYPEVPAPPLAYHLTNDTALQHIISAGEGLRPMGRDYIHLHQKINPRVLNLNDPKRQVIVEVHFPAGGFTCYDPQNNGYLFSKKDIPASWLQRKCTLREYLDNGHQFPQ